MVCSIFWDAWLMRQYLIALVNTLVVSDLHRFHCKTTQNLLITPMQVDKKTILQRFADVYQALIEAVGNWSEQELDRYVIPHPALGKLTILEMLHFTSAHTQHHLRLLPKIEKR